MLLEGFDEIAKQAEKSGDAVRASIEAMSVQATKTIQEAADRLTSTLNTTHEQIIEFAALNAKSVSEMSDKLNLSVSTVQDRTAKLGDAVDEVVERFKSSRSPDELFIAEVAPVVAALRELVEAQSKAAGENAIANRDVTKKVLSAITPFKQTNATLTALSAKLENVNSSTTGSTQAIAAMLERWETIAVNTQSVADATSALTSDIQRSTAVAKDGTAALIANSGKLSTLLDEAGKHATGVAAISKSLVDITSANTQQSALLEEVLAAVKNSTLLRDTGATSTTAGHQAELPITLEGLSQASSVEPAAEAEKAKRGWFGR